jgi:hypothetical protein
VDTGRPAGNGSASSFRAYGILGLVLEPDPDRATRPLTTEESDLAAHYHGWLPMVAQSLRLEYPSISLSDDDLVDAAYEAFIERVKAWDPRKGLPFIQFANLRIRGAMLDAARAANPHIERQRFHERKAAAGEKLPELTARPARTYDPATQDEPDWLQRLRDDTSTLRTKLARREQEALLRQAISSRSSRLNEPGLRLRALGSKPPWLRKYQRTLPVSRSSARAMCGSDSPRRQRLQSSARSAGVHSLRLLLFLVMRGPYHSALMR